MLWGAAGSHAASRKPGRQIIYVSNGGSKDISIFELNPATGELTPRGNFVLEANPGPLAISPDRKSLYAALRTNKGVQALRINPADGSLASAGATAIGINSAYLITDHTGGYLLAADYGGDRIAVHPIHPDGSVGIMPVADRATGKNPHSIQTDPANRFVFVPLCGADRVLQFRFDARTGDLQPNDPPEVAFNLVDGPRHFAFHPKKDFVYVVNEKSSSVTALKFDRKKGTLAPLQTLSTLPVDFTGKSACADIHVAPDGKFVYASNRGHDSLAGFAIDSKSGRLTALGNTPTEKTPRAFALDAAGQFLFAAGQGSDRLATYRVNLRTGALQPLKVYEVGKSPAWVLVVSLRK
jgi:6-phosphogluconolactonase